VGAAVEVRPETDPLLVDRAALAERERLVAAAIGQDRPRPADEAVQAPQAGDALVAGAQVEVIGVAEDDLGAELDEVAVQRALHGALRPHGHEGRRRHGAVRGDEFAEARGAGLVCHAERETRGHWGIIRGVCRQCHFVASPLRRMSPPRPESGAGSRLAFAALRAHSPDATCPKASST
jgi:hypothetical protein